MLIAKYTCNASGVVPTFNSGYAYEVNETESEGIYTVEITSENDFSSCSFSGKSQLLTVEYLKVTSNVTSMYRIFYNCTNLTSLDVSNWDTSEVTAMADMFAYCTNLTSLDLSNFDTSKVNNISNMFYKCTNLTTIGLIYANIDIINQLPTPSISTIYIDANIDQTAYTGSSKLEVYEQRTVTINIPTALRSNEEIADRIYWNDENKHYYIEQNINPNTNETLETPNIIASGVKQPIYLKIYENMLSVGIQNIDASYMSINVPFFEIPIDYEYKWEDELDYIKQSFELRFPDEEDVPEGWGFMGITGEEGTGLKALIDWVDKCTDEEFVRDFDQHFNRDYTLRYFLLVITLGMVDNLGKNMMLDTWDNKIFMPRFYDCDTICSYDNSGQLKFDVDIEMTQGYWNTSSSRLWTRIRDLMHDELVAKYNNMRQNGLSYESLMECFYDEQIAKIPQKYYNMDYDVKYGPFADSYIGMANGDTYEHLKRWLQQRLRFVDTLYDYAPSYNNDVLTIRANTTEPMTLEIETYTPVYQHLSWYNNQMDKKKIDGKTSVTFTGTAMAATDQEVLIYGGSNIKSIKGISSMNPNRMLIGSATRLIELDAPNCPLLADINANKANLAPHIYLNRVNLSGCPLLGGNLIVNQSPLVREIDIRGTAVTGLNLPSSLRNLEILRLPAAISSLVLNDAGQLHTLEFDEGGAVQSVSMTNCNALTTVTNFNLEDATNITLNNSYNTVNELYFSKATNLSVSNMPNLERVIYTPNAEHEVFDKANVNNASNYTISTFNCPKLNEFITTAPYRNSYGKEYGEKKPNEVFEANVLDISSTQFTDVKLLCTTDTNKLLLPRTIKNLVVDSAYDLDTEYLTDGDYDTVHGELIEPYTTDYEGGVYKRTHKESTYLPDDPRITIDPNSNHRSYSDYILVNPNSLFKVYAINILYGIIINQYDKNKVLIQSNANPNVNANEKSYTITLSPTTYYVVCEFQYNRPSASQSGGYIVVYEELLSPNIVPSASDGSLIFSINSEQEGIWDLNGLEFDNFYTYGMNNDLKPIYGYAEKNIVIEGKDLNWIFSWGAYDQTIILNDGIVKITPLTGKGHMFGYYDKDDNLIGQDRLIDSNVEVIIPENTYRIKIESYTATASSEEFEVVYKVLEVSGIQMPKRDANYKVTIENANIKPKELPTMLYPKFINTDSPIKGVVDYNEYEGTSLDWAAAYMNRDEVDLTITDEVMLNSTSQYNMIKDSEYAIYDPRTIAIYTCNTSNVVPTFNSGFTGYSTMEIQNDDGTYAVTILSNSQDNLPTSISFSGTTSLLSVEYLNVSKLTSAGNMFRACSSLTSIDVSNWDMSTVTNMAGMFYACSSLTSLDVSKWDTSIVTNMDAVFSGCSSLTSIDVSNWDTGKVTDMRSMFSRCSNLVSVDLSNLDCSKVTTTNYMFDQCSNIRTIDLTNTNMPLTTISYMFSSCSNLEEVKCDRWINESMRNHVMDDYNVTDLIKGTKKLKTDIFMYLCGIYRMRKYENTNATEPRIIDFSGIDTSRMTYISVYGNTTSIINLHSETGIDLPLRYANSLTHIDNCHFKWSQYGFMYYGGGGSTLDIIFETTENSTNYKYENWTPGLKDSVLGLSNAKFTVASIVSFLECLYDYTSKGETTSATLKLGNNLNRLTPEQIAIATNKGWTLT